MSQVMMSRPGTQQSLMKTPLLPEIQHPFSRMANPDGMLVGKQGLGRPLTAEQTYPSRRASRSANRASRASQNAERMAVHPDAIPEGVEVQAGDPSKTRLPIFGNRRELTSRGELASRAGRPNSRLSTASAQQRLEIDQLESVLKEKMKSNLHEIKKTFKNNDPENKGNLSREALHRVLVTVLGVPVTHGQFQRLMDRLGFRERTVVNFPEFFAIFKPNEPVTEHQKWMDPVHRQVHEKTMTSGIVNVYLKEKALKSDKLADLLPGLSGSNRIVRPEFRDVLDKLGFPMDEAEFDKLWAKYDADGTGSIDATVFWNKISGHEKSDDDGMPGSRRSLKKKEVERMKSLDIEKWLKRKFREGFSNMKSSFEEKDLQRTGTVIHKDFMEILSKFGLNLDMDNLALFLARCNVQPTNSHVPYRDFLHRFQDRSEDGMAHKVLTDQKHRYNKPATPGGKSTMSSMEVQLINMFQRDFLTLLGTFHKIDHLGLDYISQEEFRAAIESKFDLELTDAQFRSFIDQVPLDSEGNVIYADFMAQFDTKGRAKSLFNQEANKKAMKPIGALPRDASPPGGLAVISENPPGGQVDRLVIEEDIYAEPREQRTVQEMFRTIKELMKKNYQAVEEAFREIDELNSGRITQEMMFKLLKRLDVKPQVTRGEIRNLWKTFITNQDKTLEYLEFTRHFGYNKKSAAFPNAKVSPPKRGDHDFRQRSRKLNCAADMLQDNLRSKIDYMWDDLHREFTAIDPYDTGCVNADEFKDILKELCVYLTHYEMDMLTEKFSTVDEGRVSYVEFLKPFALRRKTWKMGNNMTQLLQHKQKNGKVKPEVANGESVHGESVHDKLRQQLTPEWRNLKRAFRKLDVGNSGSVALADFRNILKLMQVCLSDEEVFDLMSHYDLDLTGKIDYNRFLTETLKAPSTSAGRQTPLRKSAQL